MRTWARSYFPVRILIIVGFFFLASPALLFALPSGGQVAGGAATIEHATSKTTITQQSDRALLNWQGFSIGKQETVQFLQPSATSLAVNRVLGGDPSVILGNLFANGRVFLLNPNGVVFGPGSVVNVGGLLATTLALQSYDLNKGQFSFAQDPTKALAVIINRGTIAAADHGFVVLTAPGVVNDGLIVAKFGHVGLGAGTQMAVDFRGDGLIQYAVSGVVRETLRDVEGRTLEAAVGNSGHIEADGGTVLLTAQASSAVLSSVINQTGVIQARRLEQQGGEIVLRGGDEGVVMVAGALDARGEKSEKGETGEKGDNQAFGNGQWAMGGKNGDGERGGTITVTGDRVLLFGDTHADGTTGGQITVQGTKILQAGTLSANGTTGDGGVVQITGASRIIQTDSALISAQGGENGTGGTVHIRAGKAGGVFTSGTLLASGQRGGTIQVLAGDLALAAATGDASGTLGGGTILIGGDYQGHGDFPHAATTLITPFTTLKADARESGPGGNIIIWSDKETQFYGSASVRGGPNGGAGGLIEVSSKDTLYFGGNADAGATAGKPGLLLLDPKFITISNAGSIPQYVFSDPNPSADNGFGNTVVPLNNGKVVITATFDDFGASDAGAVYLFNGQTGALIATLAGSHANDQIGNGGITALPNSHYVVRSPNWDNGGVVDAGAVTWGNGTTGVAGTVSAVNSLVGSTANDQIGSGGIVVVAGVNYVIVSPNWDNGATVNVGAITWGNGTTGISGAVSNLNSIIGISANDTVGSGGVVALTNSNHYVVASPLWNDGGVADVGAVTKRDGTVATSGSVTSLISLIGSTAGDQVGSGGITALLNGNYVVGSPVWDNAGIVNAGAATWRSGSSNFPGVVSAANSLVGSTANDQVSSGGIKAILNCCVASDYVVASPFWNNGATPDVGAVTWGNGVSGTIGAVSAANSFIGTTAADQVGSGGVVPTPNGHFVVISPLWNNGAVTDTGAITWRNGTGSPSTGSPSAANSLIGGQAFDRVGSGGVTPLSGGKFVVGSPEWDNGGMADVGAVTLWNTTAGTPSVANSLIGGQANDLVGSGGVTALSNGNYVVASPSWANGGATSAGAVSWGNGGIGVAGIVSASNSLVGSKANDNVGSSVFGGGVTALSNGNYVVGSPLWDNGVTVNAGAATFGNGTTGVIGTISAANSLVGSQASDGVGQIVKALSNGRYVVASPQWNNGGAFTAGAVTWGSGTAALTGVLSTANSIIGSSGEHLGSGVATDSLNGTYLVSGSSNRVVAGYENPSIAFASGGGLSMTISTAYLTRLLENATVVLQASTDLTLAAGEVIQPSIGSFGLTLQAGRSLILDTNSHIILNGGALLAKINDEGAVVGQRDAGTAQFVMNSGTQILTNGGNVTVSVGTFGGPQLGEVRIGNGPGAAIINSGAGNIDITGVGSPGISLDVGSIIQTTSGSITFTTDTLSFIGAVDSVRGSGVLTLQPLQPTTSIGLGNGAVGTFNLTTSELLTIKDGFLVIEIGRSDGDHVISITSVTFHDPVSIRNPISGSITVDGTLQVTGNDGLTLASSGQITIGPSGMLIADTGGLGLTADVLNLNGAPDSIRGNGSLSLTPRNGSTSIGLGDGAPGTFNLTTTELLTLKDGFSHITIGLDDTSNHVITINAVTFRDPVTIQTPQGGSIAVNGKITGTGDASITLIGSHATTTLNNDIVTDGQPIVIDDSVIVAGGAGVTRTLDTTNGGATPAGADITVTGTIDANTAHPSNESLTVTAGTTGDVALGSGSLFGPTFDQPIGNTKPLDTLTATGQTVSLPQVTVGPDGEMTMTASQINLFSDMTSPNATFGLDGAVTLQADLLLDVGVGSLTLEKTVNTQSYNLTLRGNGIDLLGGDDSVTGSGTNLLRLAPGTTTASWGLADGAGTLQISTTDLNAIAGGAGGFGTVLFGRDDSTATVTLGTYTFPFPLLVAVSPLGGQGSIVVTGAVATSTLGNSLTLQAGKSIALTPGASVTTNNGPLTLTANLAGAATGNFAGIDVNGATLSAGGGTIAMIGTGGTGGANNYGIRFIANAQVQTTTGAINLQGTGGTGGTSSNVGVHLEGGSLATSGSGPISLTGIGGNGTGTSNRGVDLLGPGTIVNSTTGHIDIHGTGGATSSFSYGVVLAQGQVRSGGNVSLTGQGSAGGPGNVATLGMLITNGSQVEGLGNASVTLTGTGGTGTATSATNGEVGVFMHGQNGTFIRTANGDVAINGTGNGTGIGGQGVILRAGALVESTGTGNVSVTGIGSTTGSANSNGIQMIEAGTTVRANAGNLTMTGTAHGALNSNNNVGLAIASGALVQKTGPGGMVTITGTGGDGGGGSNNFGVALLSAPTQILANNGAITITGTGTNGAAGVTAQGGFVVAPGIPCSPCTPSANLDAGAGGTITITSTP